MQTTIESADFRLTSALERFIREQAHSSLKANRDRIEHLKIRLRDINGPKGGNDKECCVEVKIANQPPVVVRKRSTDAYASIRKALGRAARTTLRRVDKQRRKAMSIHRSQP